MLKLFMVVRDVPRFLGFSGQSGKLRNVPITPRKQFDTAKVPLLARKSVLDLLLK